MTGTETQADRNGKLGPGKMVLVVGPSGAGKDTLLNALKERLAEDPRFRFATRQITPPCGWGHRNPYSDLRGRLRRSLGRRPVCTLLARSRPSAISCLRSWTMS